MCALTRSLRFHILVPCFLPSSFLPPACALSLPNPGVCLPPLPLCASPPHLSPSLTPVLPRVTLRTHSLQRVLHAPLGRRPHAVRLHSLWCVPPPSLPPAHLSLPSFPPAHAHTRICTNERANHNAPLNNRIRRRAHVVRRPPGAQGVCVDRVLVLCVFPPSPSLFFLCPHPRFVSVHAQGLALPLLPSPFPPLPPTFRPRPLPPLIHPSLPHPTHPFPVFTSSPLPAHPASNHPHTRFQSSPPLPIIPTASDHPHTRFQSSPHPPLPTIPTPTSNHPHIRRMTHTLTQNPSQHTGFAIAAFTLRYALAQRTRGNTHIFQGPLSRYVPRVGYRSSEFLQFENRRRFEVVDPAFLRWPRGSLLFEVDLEAPGSRGGAFIDWTGLDWTAKARRTAGFFRCGVAVFFFFASFFLLLRDEKIFSFFLSLILWIISFRTYRWHRIASPVGARRAFSFFVYIP